MDPRAPGARTPEGAGGKQLRHTACAPGRPSFPRVWEEGARDAGWVLGVGFAEGLGYSQAQRGRAGSCGVPCRPQAPSPSPIYLCT